VLSSPCVRKVLGRGARDIEQSGLRKPFSSDFDTLLSLKAPEVSRSRAPKVSLSLATNPGNRVRIGASEVSWIIPHTE
jgi:hypothetical protein